MRVPGFFMQVFYYFAIMKSRHFPIVIFTSIFVFATCSQKQPDQAVQTAQQSVEEKPLLDMLSLYRAKRFESVREAISSPDTVYKLVLYGQKLGKIAPEIAELKYLNSLDLAFNELSGVPPYIKDLGYLQGLYLNGNNITELKSLHLDHNQLTEIPEGISSLTNLTNLRFEHNNLTDIPEDLAHIVQLKELWLQGNAIPPEKITCLKDQLPTTRIRF